ncbi:MAG: DNA repair protein RadC [Erysipelotrichaceae bacterium]
MLELKELAVSERPREKCIRFGIRSLSHTELLALILRSGTKSHSVFSIADELLRKAKGIRRLSQLTLQDLCEVHGIDKAKACEMMAVCELARRMALEEVYEQDVVDQPGRLVDWLRRELGDAQQEHFLVVFLDTKNHILGHKVCFIGSLDRSVVHPREIFKEAVAYSAARIIAVHNHPSGDVTPSENDIQVTKSLEEAGIMMGIPLLDHLIVSHRTFYSLRQKIGTHP